MDKFRFLLDLYLWLRRSAASEGHHFYLHVAEVNLECSSVHFRTDSDTASRGNVHFRLKRLPFILGQGLGLGFGRRSRSDVRTVSGEGGIRREYRDPAFLGGIFLGSCEHLHLQFCILFQTSQGRGYHITRGTASAEADCSAHRREEAIRARGTFPVVRRPAEQRLSVQPCIAGCGRGLVCIGQDSSVLGKIRSKFVVAGRVRSAECIVPIVDIHAGKVHHRIAGAPEQVVEILVQDQVSGRGFRCLQEVRIGGCGGIFDRRALAVGCPGHLHPIVGRGLEAGEHMTGLLSAKIGSLRSCRPFPHLLRTGLVLKDAEGVAFGQIGCEILEVAHAPAQCDLTVIHIHFLLHYGIRIGCDIVGLDEFHLHVVQPGLLQGPDRSAYSYASAGGKRDLDTVLLPLRIAQRDAFRNRKGLDFRSLDIEGVAFNRDGCREGGNINLVIRRSGRRGEADLHLVGSSFYTLDRRSYEESRSAAPAKADNAAQCGRIAQFAHISKPAYERSRCIVSACSGLQATVGMQEHIKVVRHRRSHLVVGRLVGSAEGGGIIRQRDTGKLAERISSSPHQFVEVLAEHHVSRFRGRAHHEIGLGGQSGVFIHGLGAGTDGYLYPVVGRGRESGEHVSGIAASEGRGIGSSSPFPHLLQTGLVPVNAEGVDFRQIGGQVLVFGYAPGQSHLRVVDEN